MENENPFTFSFVLVVRVFFFKIKKIGDNLLEKKLSSSHPLPSILYEVLVSF